MSGVRWEHGHDLRPGDRVRLLRWAVSPGGFDDNMVVPPGTEGVVSEVNALNCHVTWDNGHRLKLLAEDQFVVLERADG